MWLIREEVSDPGVPGAILMCVQTLQLLIVRLDIQCAQSHLKNGLSKKLMYIQEQTALLIRNTIMILTEIVHV